MSGTRGTPVEDLTDDQLNALVNIERVCSILSILGCAFIICTFLTSKTFHKPINRLVFFASVGNVITNIATLIGRSALDNVAGPFCQLQAFLIQMFMCADAFWTLAMACNVYLTFFHQYDAEKLRKMEKWYILGCYGVPFIPALVYIFIQDSQGQRLYGNATLWCWVSSSFDAIRIATFYGPVWVAMLITFVIYIRAGREIWNKRKQLNTLSNTTFDPSPVESTLTTEVHVTSEAVEEDRKPMDPSQLGHRRATEEKPIYSVSVSTHHHRASTNRYADPKSIPRSELRRIHRYAVSEPKSATWGYTKVAVLFFTAMLVTWIPSSANRLFSVANPGRVSLGLLYTSSFVLPLQGFWNAVIYITTTLGPCRLLFADLFSHRRNKASRNNRNKNDNKSFEMTAAGARNGLRGHNVETEETDERSVKTEDGRSVKTEDGTSVKTEDGRSVKTEDTESSATLATRPATSGSHE